MVSCHSSGNPPLCNNDPVQAWRMIEHSPGQPLRSETCDIGLWLVGHLALPSAGFPSMCFREGPWAAQGLVASARTRARALALLPLQCWWGTAVGGDTDEGAAGCQENSGFRGFNCVSTWKPPPNQGPLMACPTRVTLRLRGPSWHGSALHWLYLGLGSLSRDRSIRTWLVQHHFGRCDPYLPVASSHAALVAGRG